MGKKLPVQPGLLNAASTNEWRCSLRLHWQLTRASGGCESPREAGQFNMLFYRFYANSALKNLCFLCFTETAVAEVSRNPLDRTQRSFRTTA
jgi:hypothetical protein